MQDVLKKLHFNNGGIVLDAPSPLKAEFQKAGLKTTLGKNASSVSTLVFVTNEQEYRAFLRNQLKQIEADSLLWFAYPKGASKIKTDINRDSLREIGEEFGITTVTAVSINDTWSALRFRPVDRVGK